MVKKIVFILALALFMGGCSLNNQANKNIISSEEAKNKADSFVNEFLIEGEDQKAEIAEIIEENDLYKLKINISGQEFESYMTKDGEKFFISAIDMDNPESQIGANGASADQQIQMSPSDQAQSLISQGRGILDQYGETLNEQDKLEFSGKIDELENLTKSSETTPEELQAKMQEVQSIGEPLVKEIMEQQESQSIEVE